MKRNEYIERLWGYETIKPPLTVFRGGFSAANYFLTRRYF